MIVHNSWEVAEYSSECRCGLVHGHPRRQPNTTLNSDGAAGRRSLDRAKSVPAMTNISKRPRDGAMVTYVQHGPQVHPQKSSATGLSSNRSCGEKHRLERGMKQDESIRAQNLSQPTSLLTSNHKLKPCRGPSPNYVVVLALCLVSFVIFGVLSMLFREVLLSIGRLLRLF